jgi:UPF0755 protein
MMMKKNNLAKLGIPIAVLVIGWSGTGWWLWAVSPPQSSAVSTVRITIPEGSSAQAIAEKLEQAGVIRSGLALRLLIKWQAWQAGERLPLQAGTYELPTNLSLPEVVVRLQTAQSQIKVMRVTIPEGYNLRQMAELFEEKGLFTKAEFLAIADRSPNNRRSWLPPDLPNLEGFLFPDTYEMIVGLTTAEAVVEMMLDRFAEVALPVYQAHQQQLPPPTVNLSLKDWVALASIVEKEAVLAKERRLIAGVFWRRLQKKMRLESDPTVEYGLGIRQTKERPLTLQQVRTPHPYNTYLNQGLPPGAIASPGLASLEAVLRPEPTEYLFFVARYDGSHAFSRTLEEHKKQIERIEQKIKQEGRD